MFFQIDPMFWWGMALVGAVVVIGCAVAWLLPPKKPAEKKE